MEVMVQYVLSFNIFHNSGNFFFFSSDEADVGDEFEVQAFEDNYSSPPSRIWFLIIPLVFFLAMFVLQKYYPTENRELTVSFL